MPEGPEVKRCAQLLSSIIEGKTLTEINTISGKLNRTGIKNIDLPLWNRVKSVESYGKVIFIDVEEAVIVSTLGMSGWWYPPIGQLSEEQLSHKVYHAGSMIPATSVIAKALKHVRLELVMSDGTSALYCDPRNFGNITIMDQYQALDKRMSLGVDLLNRSLTEHTATLALTALSKQGHRPLGEVLLNQSVLSGVGNIYRAEVLYLAGISPHRTFNELVDGDKLSLIEAVWYVLRVAHRGEGTVSYTERLLNWREWSSSLYAAMHEVLEKINEHQIIRRHTVYGCATDPFGNEVKRDVLGGRTMWWCPERQL